MQSKFNVFARAPNGQGDFPSDRRDSFVVELWDLNQDHDYTNGIPPGGGRVIDYVVDVRHPSFEFGGQTDDELEANVKDITAFLDDPLNAFGPLLPDRVVTGSCNTTTANTSITTTTNIHNVVAHTRHLHVLQSSNPAFSGNPSPRPEGGEHLSY